jgi:GNAT superfamily N-acetyltransferase
LLSDERLRFASAASVSLEEYAATFTAAFSGYFFPLTLDATMLARKVRVEQHDLRHSLVAYVGCEAVGVAALAVRGESGWVGGFGVVPEQRGRGLGREIMSALLDEARACRLRRLSLEVLAQNTAARRLYESAGMKVVRDLLILARAVSSTVETDASDDSSKVEGDGSSKVEASDSTKVGEGGSLKEAAPAELLAHFARLHREPAAWQRDLPSMLAGRSRGFYTGERERPRAYALVSEASDGNKYLSDLAASDVESARELCDALLPAAGALRIVNEPERSLFVEPLLAHGFAETARQHEMTLDL